MKLILTGSSGFVGHELLTQCLQHPSITSVVALSRRELAVHDKLQVMLMEDFSSYPKAAREAIKDADACIWTLGITPSKASDEDVARRVSIDYTISAARLFNETCRKPFRFVYCSGSGAEQDPTKSLWFFGNYRRIRGQVEAELLAFSNENSDFEAYIVKPALILSREYNFRSLLCSLPVVPSVQVDRLATKMLDLSLGGGDKKVWENADIK